MAHSGLGADAFDIDGSVLEGGGQILRIAVSLSAILRRPLRMHKIRAGREKPGLGNQHTRGIELVAQMCNGKLVGCQVKSSELSISPGDLVSGDFIGDSVTAGSIGLLLQVALPCAIFADGPCTLRLRGGTNADFAPPVDYVEKVLLPTLTRFGIQAEYHLLRRGYYPKGGGEVVVKVKPVHKLSPIQLLEPNNVTQISVYSYVAGQLPLRVAKECAAEVEQILHRDLGNGKLNKLVKKETEAGAVGSGSGAFVNFETVGDHVTSAYGSSVLTNQSAAHHDPVFWVQAVWADTTSGCTIGGSANGSRNKLSKAVAEEATKPVVSAVKSGVCVDEHLQDQYLSGPLTLHTKTAIFVCESMTGVKFQIADSGNGNCLVGCTGIGFKNRNLPSK